MHVHRSFPFLEGLRGVLCVVVVVHHFGCAFFPCVIFGPSVTWVDNVTTCPEINKTRQFIAFLYNGKFAVVAFFVLSGFVLAHGPLSNTKGGLQLSIATVKRYFRLCLPCAMATAWSYTLAGFTKHADAAASITASRWLREFGPHRPSVAGLLAEVLWGIWNGRHALNNAMWSMRWELQGSMLIFGMLAIMKACNIYSLGQRLKLLAVCVSFLLGPSASHQPTLNLQVEWWEPDHNSSAISLPLLEMHLIQSLLPQQVNGIAFREEVDPPAVRPPSITSPKLDASRAMQGLRQSTHINVIVEQAWGWSCDCPTMLLVPFLTGMGLAAVHIVHPDMAPISSLPAKLVSVATAYLCANYPFNLAPMLTEVHPVFVGMRAMAQFLMVGQSHDVFWYCVGATCLVHSVLVSPTCQAILSQPTFVWLGGISFGLYLSHIPLIYTLVSFLFLQVHSSGGDPVDPTRHMYELAVVASFAVAMPIMLFVAFLFTKYVDKPSITLSPSIAKYVLSLQQAAGSELETSRRLLLVGES